MSLGELGHGLRERLRRAWHFWRGPRPEELEQARRALRGREYYKMYEDRYRMLGEAGILERNFIGIVRVREVVYHDWEELARSGLVPGPGARIVDLGCGEGENAIHFAEAGYQVTGVDVSPTAVASASALARRRSLDAEFILGDVVRLPALSDATFDAAIDIGCLHMLVAEIHRDAYLSEVRRLLRPGGAYFLFNRATRKDVRIDDEVTYIDRSISYIERRWIGSARTWLPTRACGFRSASERQYRSELERAGFEVPLLRAHPREGYVMALARVPEQHATR